MLSETETEPFLKTSEGLDNNIPKNPKNRWFVPKSAIASGILVFILTSLVWSSVILTTWLIHTHHSAPHSKSTLPFFRNAGYISCGRSNEEAKARGCKYDILLNHWVPAPCVDEKAIEEYQADGSWIGYADEARTERLSIDDMAEKEFYYTNERDHIVHCASLWKKQFRAFAEGRTRFDSITADQAHTDHCADYLVNMTDFGSDLRTAPIQVFVGFGGCYLKD